MAANLDDTLKYFDALDSTNKVLPIYCEASNLLRLPSLSLDPIAEQVNHNSQSLSTLADVVERLDKKLSFFLDFSSFPSVQRSFAMAASSAPPTQVASPSPVSVQKNTTPRSSSSDGHELYVILFGLPDEGSIVYAKQLWMKCLSFSQGSNFI